MSIARARQPGQAIPLTVLILPFLLAFTLLVVEVAERWLEVAMVEDALQQATRSAVQTLDYATFAQGGTTLRGGEVCVAVTVAEATTLPCGPVVQAADRVLRVNLRGVRGLVGSTPAAAIDQAASVVRWSVYPQGGSCSFSDGGIVPEEPTPLLCAELRPTLRGLVGWGTYTPLITAADRLDPAGQP